MFHKLSCFMFAGSHKFFQLFHNKLQNYIGRSVGKWLLCLWADLYLKRLKTQNQRVNWANVSSKCIIVVNIYIYIYTY
jgi:hypothetical protein